jgi:protein-disulfide isomerase
VDCVAVSSQEDNVIRRLSLAGLIFLVVLAFGVSRLPRYKSAAAARPKPAASNSTPVSPVATSLSTTEGVTANPASTKDATADPTPAERSSAQPALAQPTSAQPASFQPMSAQPLLAYPAPQALQGVTDIDPHQAEGSKGAPMIMEVFSDYQCPACKQLFITTDRLTVDNYVNTGKIYLIHRDYPLPMHAYSRIAARYARAAAQLGKLGPVQQALFQNQEKWEVSGDVDGTVAAVLPPAEMVKIRALVKGGTMDALIDKDYALGQIYHVNSTPTIILHAKDQTYPVTGVVTFDTLHTFIDQLLSQK